MTLFRLSRFRVLLLVLAAAFLAGQAQAADGGFGATMSADQQAAAGLTQLSPVERVVLDQLVAGELASIRRTEPAELAGTFISRRTEIERKSAGLDRLTEAQLAKLNEYAASALAARAKPKERPRLKENEVLAAAKKNEIHGSVTVAYGWGRDGRDMWAESLQLNYYDPESRVGIAVGLSNFTGNGYYGYSPDYFGYNGGQYYGNVPFYLETSYRGGGLGGNFNFGDGQSFRGGGGRCLGQGGGRGR
ncbi:MAG: hypothetical protein PSU94_10840 [Lacunisphaera sp.]|nr:hypothetical protein [Lacunisphaera sp.]